LYSIELECTLLRWAMSKRGLPCGTSGHRYPPADRRRRTNALPEPRLRCDPRSRPSPTKPAWRFRPSTPSMVRRRESSRAARLRLAPAGSRRPVRGSPSGGRRRGEVEAVRALDPAALGVRARCCRDPWRRCRDGRLGPGRGRARARKAEAGIDRLARTLEAQLAPGIDLAHATAIIDALTLPEVYAELIDVAHWDADEFEAWLARSLRNQLLA